MRKEVLLGLFLIVLFLTPKIFALEQESLRGHSSEIEEISYDLYPSLNEVYLNFNFLDNPDASLTLSFYSLFSPGLENEFILPYTPYEYPADPHYSGIVFHTASTRFHGSVNGELIHLIADHPSNHDTIYLNLQGVLKPSEGRPGEVIFYTLTGDIYVDKTSGQPSGAANFYFETFTSNDEQKIQSLEDEVSVITLNQTEQNGRISTLESQQQSFEDWRQTIEDWKTSITDSVTNLVSQIADLFTTTDDHETRIQTLESQEPPEPSQQNVSLSSYWKYLDFRTKEDVACGRGEDNQLELYKMEDLGASCEIEYTRGRARCDCEEVVGECELDSPLYCYAWELRRDNLNLEIKNIGTEDIDIESIQVDGCELEDRGGRIRAGYDKKLRVDCTESFEGGDITIQYLDENDILHTSEGQISLV